MDKWLEKFKNLEKELLQEIQQKEKEFFYKIKKKRVRFEKEVRQQHKLLVKKTFRYIKDARILVILTAPIIWFCLVPALLMDLVISFYQCICFPIYGIPKVERGDFIVIDRHYLAYLNPIEKMNCAYCGYFNGVIAYSREIAARTEQYWCPIKHARKTRALHNRFAYFFDYGDGKRYRQEIETVRRNFKDL